MAAKHALVTGGAKRVGRAIVERLFDAGFTVYFTYNSSKSPAIELRDQLNARRTDSAVALHANFSEKGDASLFLAATKKARVPFFLLVNSASIYGTNDKLDLTRAMQVNFEAPCRIVRELAPVLRENRGRVINMLDILAERPIPRYSNYCASKAALWNATLSLARELAPEATVNGIAPGVVDWPDDFPQADRDAYLNRVPLARAGTPKDVADLVHFLATDGSYITGQVIRLDGGRSIT